ncbi:hypothetical protein D9756_010462 [Leucocoprinus leucothites]|uniref:Uncharacterized protein n=1 Tax=Leucocoprinus leucothites TaxID=201217 RepID=A0A8H5CVS4_9AGAR|nr:hypothetical protein D9756_010462 [Leucoagaricus leucothites]
MSSLAVPSDTHKSSSRERASTWAQPPTLIITSSDSASSSVPSSAYAKSEPEQAPGSSAGPEDSEIDVLNPEPRGHRLAWTIPSQIVQPPSIPAFSQISISLSTLSFTRSRSKPSPSSSQLFSSPSTPAALSSSGTKSDQRDTQNKSPAPSHFLRAPSPHPSHFAHDWGSNDTSLSDRGRANSFYTSFAPSAASRRSAFTSTAAFFTSMSRPSWDPSPLIISTSSSTTASASASPSTTTAPKSIISNSNPISLEDARLLDPTYLSSVPIPFQNISHGLCTGGSSGLGAAAYSHAIPYVDPQGTLHDPDYRPFPLIRQAKRPSISPFAIRRPYWETDLDDEDSDSFLGGGEDGYDTDGSTPSTPTSITPFIYYFLETHPLKRGTPLRNNHKINDSSSIFGSNYGSSDRRNAERGKRGKGPGSQFKLGTAYMCATIATGLGGKNSQGGHNAYTPTTPTRATANSINAPIIPQYAATLSTSPPPTEDVSHHGKEKEKKGWGGLLWKSGGRKEGGD